MRAWVALALACTLSGCASMREDQCPKVDWFELGVRDGRAGHPAERLVEHREACAGANVAPDEAQYLQGRREGIAVYCQIDNAVTEGLAGRRYHGLCNAAWVRNYQAGYAVASVRSQIDDNLSTVSRNEAELRSERTSDARRSQLRSEIRELDRRRESLRVAQANAERELARVLAGTSPVAQPPVPDAAAATKPAPPPRITLGAPGKADGRLTLATVVVPLRYAYTFIAPDPMDRLVTRPMVVITQDPIPPADIAQAPDLDRLLAKLPAYVLASRNDAKPAKVTLVIAHPVMPSGLGFDLDAVTTGMARFESYGSDRIAGRISSPQNGKNAYAWNRSVRLDVQVDAPLMRRWPEPATAAR